MLSEFQIELSLIPLEIKYGTVKYAISEKCHLSEFNVMENLSEKYQGLSNAATQWTILDLYHDAYFCWKQCCISRTYNRLEYRRQTWPYICYKVSPHKFSIHSNCHKVANVFYLNTLWLKKKKREIEIECIL